METRTNSNVTCFNNVNVVPFTGMADNPTGGKFHEGGPIFPNWESAAPYRWNTKGAPGDFEPVVPYWANFSVLEKAVWLGPLIEHFGHFIADVATRFLWSRNMDEDCIFLVGDRSYARFPNFHQPFHKEILDWYDIPLERLRLVGEPVLVRNLFVARQAEQLPGVGPTESYLDELTEFHQKKLGKSPKNAMPRKVFVSRSRIPVGILAGGSYLDNVFANAGYQPFHPEFFPLETQIRTYASAEHLVFVEGSSLHTLQLLGRINAKVDVIGRRSGEVQKASLNIPNFCEPFVRPRVSSLRIHERGIYHLHGSSETGHPAPAPGITISDARSIKETVEDIVGSEVRHFDIQEFEESVLKEIKDWKNYPFIKLCATHPSHTKILGKKIQETVSLPYKRAIEEILEINAK